MGIDKQSIYQDYLTLRCLKAGLEIKRDLIERLLKQRPDRWRVIGITETALHAISNSDFKSRKGVNRGHLVRRVDTYREVTEREFPLDEFFSFIHERDSTVLHVKGEGERLTKVGYIEFPSENLFMAKAKGYTFGTDEKNYLQSLYNEHCNPE